MSAEADKLAVEARTEARHAERIERFWWANLVWVAAYWFVSKEPWPERLMLCYLAAVSIIALAATYGAQKKAAEAKAAGYENP